MNCGAKLLFWSFLLLVHESNGFLYAEISRPFRSQKACQHRAHLQGNNNEITRDSVDSYRRETVRVVSSMLLVVANAFPANAVMANTQKVFEPGKDLSVSEALARVVEARESLNYLANNFDKILAAGGGDSARRYLGTVGTTSGLYGIEKVLKLLQSEAEDIVEFTEEMNEFNYSLRAADTALYSANFVTFSSARTKPEEFFANAKAETKRMQAKLNVLTEQLNIK